MNKSERSTEKNSNESSAVSRPLCSVDSVTNRTSHLISFNEAIDYIWAFHSRFPSLGNIGWTEIPEINVRKGLLHCGLLAYYCKENANTYFLAFCFNPGLNDDDDPFPNIPQLHYNKSECSNRFTNRSSRSDIENEIVSIRSICSSISPEIIMAEIIEKASAFLDEINSLGSNLSEPVGFFHEVQLDEVLNQTDCEGLRVYWGFENTPPDNIKIIAFGVNSKGENIIGAGAKILEKSWPPF